MLPGPFVCQIRSARDTGSARCWGSRIKWTKGNGCRAAGGAAAARYAPLVDNIGRIGATIVRPDPRHRQVSLLAARVGTDPISGATLFAALCDLLTDRSTDSDT